MLKLIVSTFLLIFSLYAGGSEVCDSWAAKGLRKLTPGSRFSYYNTDNRLRRYRVRGEGHHIRVIEHSRRYRGDPTACLVEFHDANGNVTTGTLLLNKFSEPYIGDEPDINRPIEILSDLNGKKDNSSILTSPEHCEPSEEEESENDFPGLSSELDFNKSCNSFIEDDGSYGEYGKFIENYLSKEDENDSPLLVDDVPDMDVTCPKWSTFSKEQKVHFWTHTFAAISMDESTCNPRATNPRGTDGVAVGLTQMPKRKNGQKGYYWRGPNCRKATDMYDPEQNLSCALDIMKELMRGQDGVYKNRGGIFGKKNTSYWEKLKRKDDPKKSKIIRLMLTYKPCGFE